MSSASHLSKSVDLSQAYRKQASPLGIRRLITPHTRGHVDHSTHAHMDNRRLQRVFKPTISNDSLSQRSDFTGNTSMNNAKNNHEVRSHSISDIF